MSKKKPDSLDFKNWKRLAQLSIQTDDEDQIAFWRNVERWAGDINAKRYAAKRLEAVLVEIMAITKEDVHKFYMAQGQLIELFKFSNLPGLLKDKIDEVIEGINSENEPHEEEGSLTEKFGE